MSKLTVVDVLDCLPQFEKSLIWRSVGGEDGTIGTSNLRDGFIFLHLKKIKITFIQITILSYTYIGHILFVTLILND